MNAPIHMLVGHIDDTMKLTLYNSGPRTQKRFERSHSTAPHRRLLYLAIGVDAINIVSIDFDVYKYI